MGFQIDVQALQSDLEVVRAKFDNWAADVCASNQSVRDTHVKNIEEGKENIANLSAKEEVLEAEAEELQKRLQQEHEEGSRLQAEVADLQQKEKQLPLQVEQLQTVCANERERLASQSAEINNQLKHREQKLAAFSSALSCYEQRLGLKLEKIGEASELAFIFTKIDPQNPQAEYAFAVEVLDGNQYKVTSCEPPVEALPELLSALNDTGNFSQFVRGMRKQFKHMVNGNA